MNAPAIAAICGSGTITAGLVTAGAVAARVLRPAAEAALEAVRNGHSLTLTVALKPPQPPRAVVPAAESLAAPAAAEPPAAPAQGLAAA